MGRTSSTRATRRRSPRSTVVQLAGDFLEVGLAGGAQTHEQPVLFDLPGPTLRAVPVSQAEPEPSPEHVGRARRPADLGDVFASVLDFHRAFDLPRAPLPTVRVSDALAELRVRLLREEVDEFIDATAQRDLTAIADALADVVYVAYGSAVTYGIDLDAVIREVHRANMSKLDEHGRPILREDGKVLKSRGYRPPDVATVLDCQLELFSTEEPGAVRSVLA